MELKLVLPLPTSINKLYINQHQYNPKTRSYEPTGKRILSKEGRKVKARIQGEARVQSQGQNWDYDWTKENYCYQDAVIFFARRGADDNNIYKLLNDSLEGIVYDNDSRVLVRTQKIMYDSKNPRVEVTLKPVDFIGIFDNKNELDKFIKRCQNCSRYRQGKCSILTDSQKGIVRQEISDVNSPYCMSFKEKSSKK
jgi:Holliday junction resolvase RusA-like endonuclease